MSTKLNKFERGSEWRKWDLHVHTPKSIIQNFGGDNEEVWEKYISDLESLPSEIKAIGINDYIFIDGYRKVLEYKDKGRLSNIDLILPVIELRVDKFASVGDEAWKKINLHVIFSNQIPPDTIEAQFLSAIQHSIKISPDVEGVDFQGVATRDALEEIGKKIKESSKVEIKGSDLKVGFWNIFFDYKTVLDITKGFFEGNCLTAIGKSEWDTMRWDGSAAMKKSIINEADFTFISLDKASDYQKHIVALDGQKVKSLLLDCSDAHSFSEETAIKDRIGNSFCWLKADTTFEGLKQIANDKSRIFIGDYPPLLQRFKSNKTKFIRNLTINKVTGSTLVEDWFDGFELPLNPSMVAIIGNKGNGKSAIADTLGLVGNTPHHQFFSFLTTNKFRNKRPINKSEHFEGIITWEDGNEDKRRLDQNPLKSNIEKIKYIPQGFLERLCNDDVDDFENELRNVIFSHIGDTDRLGKNNLNDLIEYKTEILNSEIEDIKKDIYTTNKSIVELEKKQTQDYRNLIEGKLKEKEAELAAHELLKPISVEPPNDPKIVEQNKETIELIEAKRNSVKEIEEELVKLQKSLKPLKIEVSELDKILQNINGFENQFEKLKIDISPILISNGLNFDSIVELKINKNSIQILLTEKNDQLGKIENTIGLKGDSGLNFKKSTLDSELKELLNKLDGYSKKYQKFVQEKKEWDEKKAVIIGSSDKDESIEYYKGIIKYLDEKLEIEIKELIEIRFELLRNLFNKKEETINLYKSLFKPVLDFIQAYGEVLANYSITLDVDYKVNSLVEKFFDHVSLGAKGSFISNPSGIERLNQIIESHDLKTESGIVGFLTEIIDNLKLDKREGFEGEKREISKQLKKGYSTLDLYSFLFSLDYLQPEYKLKLGEKSISELSPGERGALLLIFYLTLDQDDIPLVIDQPEENLDNQSVYKILVQFIKDAKEKRQIVIITHNPNLAVACSAEQVVHINIDKQHKNKVSFVSGSLENKLINDAVIDILEGTYPALNTRTNTYKVIKRK